MSNPAVEPWLTPSQLLALSVEPNWAREDPERRTWLAVELAAEPQFEREDSIRLRAWLAQQPIPVVGVGESGTSDLADVMDLVVEDPAELQPVKERIEKHPRACAVLVQVLRVSGELDIFDALAVESMAYAAFAGGRGVRPLAGGAATHAPQTRSRRRHRAARPARGQPANRAELSAEPQRPVGGDARCARRCLPVRRSRHLHQAHRRIRQRTLLQRWRRPERVSAP